MKKIYLVMRLDGDNSSVIQAYSELHKSEAYSLCNAFNQAAISVPELSYYVETTYLMDN